MNHNLQKDFLVDKENHTITIRREFNAKRALVWDCYTKSELLDQWFAPLPFVAETKSMDFREGGHWHFAMVEPGGAKHWNWIDYLKITPLEKYTAKDAFSNEVGEINENFPRSSNQVSFTDKGENALVETVVSYNSLADLEMVIQMGLEQGLKATSEKLDELLIKLKQA